MTRPTIAPSPEPGIKLSFTANKQAKNSATVTLIKVANPSVNQIFLIVPPMLSDSLFDEFDEPPADEMPMATPRLVSSN